MAPVTTETTEPRDWIPAVESAPNWRDGLRRYNTGSIIPQLANVIHALKFAPDFNGVLWFDDFALQTVARIPAPWQSKSGETWTDNDDRKLAEWCQHKGINVGVELAAHGVQAVAFENRFHPLRDWLTSLKWDQIKRLDGWPTLYMGATPTLFNRGVGAKFLIGAVARVLRPGSKADCILVLEGPQGIGKSTAIRVLFEPYFCDHLPDLGSKDAFLQIRGVWGVEISELSAISRSSAERVKSFLSAETDRYRPPYGRRPIDVPRSCVFLGTTNSEAYLFDETGGRRFWPIRCGQIDLKALRRDRDQLFAEAVVRFMTGEKWWIEDLALHRVASDIQQERLAVDAWHELIETWLTSPTQRVDESGHAIYPFTSIQNCVSVADILIHAIGKRIDQWGQADANRVARTLVALKWKRVRRRDAGGLVWRYVPTVPTSEVAR